VRLGRASWPRFWGDCQAASGSQAGGATWVSRDGLGPVLTTVTVTGKRTSGIGPENRRNTGPAHRGTFPSDNSDLGSPFNRSLA